MKVFNGLSFNDFREQRLKNAIAEIAKSNTPNEEADDIIADYRLDEVSADWAALKAEAIGAEVFVAVPVAGEPFLFTTRVSTNNDPLPNCTLDVPQDGDDADQSARLVWKYTLNQPLNTILNAAQAARTIAQQHVNFVNDGVRLYNQTLEAKVREAVRQRLISFSEAKKVADALNERLNPAAH